MSTLSKVKDRLGLPSDVKIYDDEIGDLIMAAEKDMVASGVPKALAEGMDDERVTLAITSFVKANYGDDRANATRYTQMYQSMVFRLCQEEGGS